MLVPLLYRLAAQLLLGPCGGLPALRDEVVRAASTVEGTRVLEVGCGPGALTRRLLDAGARVHTVDASAGMLAEAKRRAPEAAFELADARAYRPSLPTTCCSSPPEGSSCGVRSIVPAEGR